MERRRGWGIQDDAHLWLSAWVAGNWGLGVAIGCGPRGCAVVNTFLGQ